MQTFLMCTTVHSETELSNDAPRLLGELPDVRLDAPIHVRIPLAA